MANVVQAMRAKYHNRSEDEELLAMVIVFREGIGQRQRKEKRRMPINFGIKCQSVQYQDIPSELYIIQLNLETTTATTDLIFDHSLGPRQLTSSYIINSKW